MLEGGPSHRVRELGTQPTTIGSETCAYWMEASRAHQKETSLSQNHQLHRQFCLHQQLHEWRSPVVMVCKKDGSHYFCADYRVLNFVTNAHTFPMPCRSTRAASGFWQIQMDAGSREKTVLVKNCLTTLSGGYTNVWSSRGLVIRSWCPIFYYS